MDKDKESDKFVPHGMHIAHTQDGQGTYSAEALGYYKTNATAIPLVQQAIKSSYVHPGSVFTVVDYGAADGGTSMPLMYQVVKAVREKYGEDMPIKVIYEDQPVNDFKSVFLRLQGFITGPRSYLKDFNNVYALACGTNFYSQCVPSNTVQLSFSATSVHWLREKPCDITGALHHSMMTVPEEKKKFSVQAEKDWEVFLLHRAEELAPGGYLILVQDLFDEQGDIFPTENKLTAYNIHKNICKLWEEFVAERKITKEEFKHTTFGNYNRSIAEFKKPFVNPNSPVKKKGLEWVSMETRISLCPHRERWRKYGGDPKEHAKRFLSIIRAWSGAVLMSGLSDLRTSKEKVKIVDDLFNRYESLVAEKPDDHEFDFLQVYIVLHKINK